MICSPFSQGNRTKFLWHLLPCWGLAPGPVPRYRCSVKGKIGLYQRNFGAIALSLFENIFNYFFPFTEGKNVYIFSLTGGKNEKGNL
jgi:hypothetical protein